jgi:hypothetical protein
MNDVEQIPERRKRYVVIVLQIMHKRLHIRTISCHGASKSGKRQDEDQRRDHEDHRGFGMQSTTTAEVSYKAGDAVYRDFVVDEHRPEGVERNRLGLHRSRYVRAENAPRYESKKGLPTTTDDLADH